MASRGALDRRWINIHTWTSQSTLERTPIATSASPPFVRVCSWASASRWVGDKESTSIRRVQ